MHEDGYWLELIRRGDHEAFACLYEKYSKAVYRAVLAVARDPLAADEILQETFVRLYQHADSLDLERPVLPWLHRVAINLTYNWIMRDQRRFVSLDDLSGRWYALRALAGTAVEVERQVEQRERISAVRAAIEKLDFDHRVVIVLFYLQGFSLAEIGETLSIPVGTAKSRLHYARKALERRLLAESPFKGEVAYEPS
ncbi:MAG: RNA polymerase sigma factor [Chloroflexi bacterium]|nr:RNA polymerase sigma factor [Chloroflexota bacterium]